MIHLSFTNSLTFPFPSKRFWYSATRENTSAITSMMPKSHVQSSRPNMFTSEDNILCVTIKIDDILSKQRLINIKIHGITFL